MHDEYDDSPSRTHLDDELGEVLPNCPSCLSRLEVAGSIERPHWWCPSCKIPVARP